MRVMVQAPAKLNLTLDVTGRRPDGYHELCSIMQAVDRCDTLTAGAGTGYPAGYGGQRAMSAGAEYRLSRGRTLLCPYRHCRWGAYDAAQAHSAAGGYGRRQCRWRCGPAGAGCAVWHGAAAGAAVCLRAVAGSGCAVLPVGRYGAGRRCGGEADPPAGAAGLRDCCCAAGTGGFHRRGVCTAGCSARWPGHPALSPALEALQRGDLAGLCRQMGNVFEPALALPQVRAIREQMAAFSPLCSQMTGQRLGRVCAVSAAGGGAGGALRGGAGTVLSGGLSLPSLRRTGGERGKNCIKLENAVHTAY